jgi:hypothetical protein
MLALEQDFEGWKSSLWRIHCHWGQQLCLGLPILSYLRNEWMHCIHIGASWTLACIQITWGPPVVSEAVGLRRSLPPPGLSNSLPGEAGAAGPWTMLWVALVNIAHLPFSLCAEVRKYSEYFKETFDQEINDILYLYIALEFPNHLIHFWLMQFCDTTVSCHSWRSRDSRESKLLVQGWHSR